MNHIILYLNKMGKGKKILLNSNDIMIQKKIEEMGFNCKFAVCKLDTNKIYAQDNDVDCFIIADYFVNVRDFRSFLNEVKRIVKPNGIILIYGSKKNSQVSIKSLYTDKNVFFINVEEDEEYVFLRNSKEHTQKTVLISPYSKSIGDGKLHAKNYPYWQTVIDELKSKGYKIIQIGGHGEKLFENIDDSFLGKSFKELKELMSNSDLWMSVDNMIQHLANTIKKPGIVIWSVSDPKLFGYKQNVNLLKDVKYLREKQFATWFEIDFNEETFIDPQKVVESVLNFV